MVLNKMMMNFIQSLFPDQFSVDTNEYGVIFFNTNVGKGARKIQIDENMVTSIIGHAEPLVANECILVHSQPTTDLESYPTQDDIDMFTVIEAGLTNANIAIYNNVVISLQSGEWQCTSFKDAGVPGNFK